MPYGAEPPPAPPPTEQCLHRRGVIGKGYYFCQRERKHRGEHAYENSLVGQTVTGRRPSEPEFQNISYSGAAGKAFQSFQRWLKREPFHRRGEYCPDKDCARCIAYHNIERELRMLADREAALEQRLQAQAGTCVGIPCTYRHPHEPCHTEASVEVWYNAWDGFRNFCSSHAARIKAFQRNVRQGYGREAGRRIAVDALVALASAPYPEDYIGGLHTPEEVREATEDFDRAARRELLKTVQESIDAS